MIISRQKLSDAYNKAMLDESCLDESFDMFEKYIEIFKINNTHIQPDIIQMRNNLYIEKIKSLQTDNADIEKQKTGNYNFDRNSDFVVDFIPNINIHDLKFLCNNIGRVFQRGNYEYPDNFRIATVDDITQEAVYKRLRKQGQCGEAEFVFLNEKTGNKFLFGFNYGY